MADFVSQNAQFPSGTNTYIPSFDATGQLVVSFSRNPKDFGLNKYITITPVKKSSGYYLKLNAEQAARVTYDKLEDHVWHDGNDAPHGEWNNEKFEWLNFNTQRYVFPFRLGYKAVDQADWKIVASYSAINAQQAMTARVVKVWKKLYESASTTSAVTTSGSADRGIQLGGTDTIDSVDCSLANNVITGGVRLDAGDSGDINTGTSNGPVIKKAFNAISRRINKATLGACGPKEMCIIINPETADAIARSKELHTYLKESPVALAQIRGDSDSMNGKYGLPDKLYGYDIIIEDVVKVSNKKGATRVSDYVVPSGDMWILARPGDLVGFEGSPSFSTVHLFAYEEMTVEQKDDPDNRRINARIVEDYGVEIVAPITAFKLKNVVTGITSA